MKKKIFTFALIIFLAVSLVFLTGCSNEENTQEVGSETENQAIENATNNESWTLQDNTNSVNDENQNVSDNTKTADETINEFYNSMSNKDFKSAASLFNEEEFKNFMSEEYSTIEEIEESLEKCYNEFSAVFATKINNINPIEDVDEFDEITGSEGTSEEEFNEILGDYDIYEAELDINSETASDIFILTKDNKIVSSAILIGYYASNNSINDQAESSATEMEKDSLKTEFDLAFTSIYMNYILEGNSANYADYCTKDVIQENLHDATIQTFAWNGNIGKGTVEYNNKTFNFTLTLSGKTDVDVSID